MDPGTAIAVGELSLKVISLISKYYSDVKNAKSDIERLDREIRDLHAVFQKTQELTQKSSLAETFSVSASLRGTSEQALVDVKGLESKLDPGPGARLMRRVGKRALKWPFEKKEVNGWIAKFERHKTTLNLALTADQFSLIHDIDNHAVQLRHGQEAEEQDRLLGKLHVAEDAFFNSYHQSESQCTAETRVELLQQLQDWGVQHQRPIFWLSGMAGTGKSTIARTLALNLSKRNSLGGSFFFSRASGSSNNAANFVSTLAYELANKSQQFKDRICEAISRSSDVLRQGLRNQWEEFIIGPLSKTKLIPRPTMTFVIDALDECASDDDIKLLLQLLVEVKNLSVIDLGVFVTSRPEITIRHGFEKIPEIIRQNLDLRDIPRQTVEHDLAVFLRGELGRISQEHRLHDWPSGGDIHLLVQRANGLFIYAATVCGFVDDKSWNPHDRLSEILQGGSSEAGGTVQLDEMYSEVLRSALTKNRREKEIVKLCDRFKQVVGSIVTLSDTLSLSALAKLLNIPAKNVELTLGTLHSVLNVPSDPEIPPIRSLHPSFHDFLSDEVRCEDKRFFVKKPSVHGKLLTRCLEVMSAALKRNMCNLQTPGSSPQDVERGDLYRQLPRHVQYACQYWVEHLACADPEQWIQLGLHDEGIIYSFFQKYYLNWLEAMSLVGKMSEAVLMVVKVRGMLKSDENPALYSLIADAHRFILSNRGILEVAPLQAYAAALVFSPKQSLVRRCYQDQYPTWLIRLPDVEDEWGPTLQILEGHTDSITDVAFSPDGNHLASASFDGTVRLWNPTTGALRSTLVDHSHGVSALAFSSKCQLATFSVDDAVRIWDPVSGVIRHILNLTGLGFGSRSLRLLIDYEYARLAFTPNSTLAIGTPDGSLRVWDPETTAVRFPKLAADPLLAISPKGDLVFMTKERTGVFLYELGRDITHKIFSTWTSISSAAFSSDGQIALALVDKKGIVLCDMGKIGSVTVRHSVPDADRITALAFSPDNKSLIFGSVGDSPKSTLRSWDLSTHTESLIGTLSTSARQMVFSPEGGQLASTCASDNAVHLWDASTKFAHKIREGYSSNIEFLVFSRDGKHLASIADSDPTLRIWYPESGKLHQTLTGHSGPMIGAVFSPDSKQIASASRDGTVRLWDLVEGTLQHILKCGTEIYLSKINHPLVYSNDGKELACGCEDEVIYIWKPSNGEFIQTLQGSSQVESAVFSPNGEVLASKSQDGTLIIWKRSTGDPLHKLKTGSIHYGLAFSPDGQYLASGFEDYSVAIWDPITGELRKKLGSHEGPISTVAFSHDSQLLAVSYYLKITLWHLETGRRLETFHVQSSSWNLSFSINGAYLENEYGEFVIGHLVDDTQRSSLSSGFGWRIMDNWLMQGSRKMLWLPPDFRPYVV